MDVEMCLNPDKYEPVRLELSKLDEIVKKPAREMSNSEFWAVFFRYHGDPGMRKMINEIAVLEEGIAMAGEALLHISRDADQRARLESEYKGQLDYQSKMVQARRDGAKERDAEIMDLIARGGTLEDIITRLGARG